MYEIKVKLKKINGKKITSLRVEPGYMFVISSDLKLVYCLLSDDMKSNQSLNPMSLCITFHFTTTTALNSKFNHPPPPPPPV